MANRIWRSRLLVRASRQPTDPIDTRRSEASSGGGDPVRSPEPVMHKPPAPSRQSLRGLDWFIFFLADVQTGFGPFVAVYLTTQKWTQVEIGLVLSIGGLVALIGQMPGGASAPASAGGPIFRGGGPGPPLHPAAGGGRGRGLAATSLAWGGLFAMG